jgi:glycerol-3-phosphate acyltransferase PlsY
MTKSILFLIFSYILGSIPFGFIFTYLSTKKNILKIGWRKTSGSNVFRHVGKWQGALTGIFDLAKGYLAVFLAQKFSFPIQIQILSGIAAIFGHNWSIFLKLAGGRGIGTFIGAGSILFPKVLGFSFITFALFSFIFNAAIATFFFLAAVFFLSIYFSQFEIAGIFVILSLFPVFIKRLSPINEIFPLKEKKSLIKNRLVFDNDQPSQ